MSVFCERLVNCTVIAVVGLLFMSMTRPAGMDIVKFKLFFIGLTAPRAKPKTTPFEAGKFVIMGVSLKHSAVMLIVWNTWLAVLPVRGLFKNADHSGV